MKTTHSRLRRGLYAVLALLLCLTLLPMTALAAAAQASAATMRLVSYTGTVTVKNSSGQNKTPSNNLQLYSGWTVETGAASTATLSLDGSKAIRLNYNTKVELRQNTTTKLLDLFVPKGGISFDVNEKLPAGASMNLSNGTFICGIRGTDGYFGQVLDDYGVNHDVLLVTDGGVAATKQGTAETMNVGTGQLLTDGGGASGLQLRQITSWDQMPALHARYMADSSRDHAAFYGTTGLTAISPAQADQMWTRENAAAENWTLKKVQELRELINKLINGNQSGQGTIVNAWDSTGTGTGGGGGGSDSAAPVASYTVALSDALKSAIETAYTLGVDVSADVKLYVNGQERTLPYAGAHANDTVKLVFAISFDDDSVCTKGIAASGAAITEAKREDGAYNELIETYGFTMPATNVTVNGGLAVAYPVDCEVDDFGSLALTAVDGVAVPADSYYCNIAAPGQTVTLTATPADNYQLATLTATDADSSPVTVTDNQFTMPAKAVTAAATFEQIPCTLTLSGLLSALIKEVDYTDQPIEVMSLNLFVNEENVTTELSDGVYQGYCGDSIEIRLYNNGDVPSARTENVAVAYTAGGGAPDDFTGWRQMAGGGYVIDTYTFTLKGHAAVTGNVVFTVGASFWSFGSDPHGRLTLSETGDLPWLDDEKNPLDNLTGIYAPQGAAMTVTVKPDEGYVLGSDGFWGAYTVDNEEISLDFTKKTSAGGEFTMPSSDVTLGAGFEEASYTVSYTGSTDNGGVEIFYWDGEEWAAYDAARGAHKDEYVLLKFTGDKAGGLYYCSEDVALTNSTDDSPVAFEEEDEESMLRSMSDGKLVDTYVFRMSAANVTVDGGFAASYRVLEGAVPDLGWVKVETVGGLTIDRETTDGQVYAAEGALVVLNAAAAGPYQLCGLDVETTEEKPVPITQVEASSFTFTMPNDDVWASPYYKESNTVALTIDLEGLIEGVQFSGLTVSVSIGAEANYTTVYSGFTEDNCTITTNALGSDVVFISLSGAAGSFTDSTVNCASSYTTEQSGTQSGGMEYESSNYHCFYDSVAEEATSYTVTFTPRTTT